MAATLLASACPLPIAFSSLVLVNTGTETTAKVARNVPASVNFRTQVNQNAALLDLVARGGGGMIGIMDGPDRITLSVPASGLQLQVSAGHAMIGGPVEIPAATSIVVPTAAARVWIWLSQAGALSYTTTTTPPTGEVCLLGSCVTSGGNITSVDTSGVVYLRGGFAWRETADSGVPGDTPPGTVMFVAKTAGGDYLWTGTAYRQLTTVGSGGTVSSVGLTMPSEFAVSGSPVTTSGTLAVTRVSQSANAVMAAPNGSAGAPAFRALVAADIPAIPESGVTNLSTDLAATEKTANKGIASGYAGLDANSKVAFAQTYNGCLLVLCEAFTPSATGADAAEITIPYSPADGTTSVTWNVRRLTVRVATAGGAPAVTFEVSTATGAFSAATIGSVTLGSGANEGSSTGAFTTATVASGNKIRLNFTALGTAQNFTCQILLGA